jgi:TonB family protein
VDGGAGGGAGGVGGIGGGTGRRMIRAAAQRGHGPIARGLQQSSFGTDIDGATMGDAGRSAAGGTGPGGRRGGLPGARRVDATPGRATSLALAAAFAASLAACAAPGTAPPTAPPPPAGPAPRAVPPAAGACPTPAFPESVRRGDAAGLTRVTGEVQPDGTVRSVVVVRSSGPTRAHKLLDRAAADAMSRCRFPPAPGTAPATTTVDYRWTAD